MFLGKKQVQTDLENKLAYKNWNKKKNWKIVNTLMDKC